MRRLFLVFVVTALMLPHVPAGAGPVVNLGVVTKPGSAQNVCAEKFKELLEARSDYRVNIHHSGSLGTETQILEKIQANTVQAGVITAGPFDEFAPETRVFGYPFLFADYREADLALEGAPGRKLLESLKRAGFKGLAFSENGFRHLTNNLKPVHSVADVEGLKVRVMESVLHQRLWRLLGANPVPLGWPINKKLAAGVVDAQENPLWAIWTYRLYEVQKYLSLTGHVYSAHINIANLGWFEGLSEKDRSMVKECMAEASRFERAWARAHEAGFLAGLKRAGMIVDEHPDIESFRARAAGIRELDIFREGEVREMLDTFLGALRPR